MDPQKHVAVFDFDGTLRKGNLDREFIKDFLGTWGTLVFIIQNFKIVYESVTHNTEKSYHAVFKRFFAGKNAETIAERSAKFARLRAKPNFNLDIMQRYLWHKKNGHTCVIISSSLLTHLQPFVNDHFQVDFVFGSTLDSKNGILTGEFLGGPCNKERKRECIQNTFGPKSNYILYAYGDTYGDLEMLEFSDYGYYIEKQYVVFNKQERILRKDLAYHQPNKKTDA